MSIIIPRCNPTCHGAYCIHPVWPCAAKKKGCWPMQKKAIRPCIEETRGTVPFPPERCIDLAKQGHWILFLSRPRIVWQIGNRVQKIGVLGQHRQMSGHLRCVSSHRDAFQPHRLSSDCRPCVGPSGGPIGYTATNRQGGGGRQSLTQYGAPSTL